MEQQVREVVELFAAPIRDATGRVDLLSAFADPIPNTVIARIAGIPPFPGDESRFRTLAQDILRRYVFFADEANIQRGNAALEELAEWILKLTADRRLERSEDLVSDLIHNPTEFDPMTDHEIMTFITSLISAGSETTTLGACHMFRHLFAHPDQLALVRRDPGLAPNAVREALRYDFGSLAAVTPRYALEDIELHGKTIRKGDSIMLSPASANRDESIFPDPHRFDVTRDAREALTFGHGPHYCLGANLAMQELTFMLEAALEFLPEDALLEQSDDDWEQVGIMRRPLRMVVDLRR
jgi:cytochrome P450